MAELEPALREDGDAVQAFVAHARAVGRDRWTAPRAPGKWCAGQVAEHVALTYEAGKATLRGESKEPGMPRWVRPLLRLFFFNKVLKTGKFPGAKAPKRFEPAAQPAAADAGLERLESAATGFAEAARRAGGTEGAMCDHPVFGRIRVVDYVRLVRLHTLHHEKQLG